MLLEWECPQDDSNSKGTHYTVQKVMGKPPPTASLQNPQMMAGSSPGCEGTAWMPVFHSWPWGNPKHVGLLLVAGGHPDICIPFCSWRGHLGIWVPSGGLLDIWVPSGRTHQNLDLFGELPRYMPPPGCGGHPKHLGVLCFGVPPVL